MYMEVSGLQGTCTFFVETESVTGLALVKQTPGVSRASTSLVLGLQEHSTTPFPPTWILGIEFGFSGLQCKCFTV